MTNYTKAFLAGAAIMMVPHLALLALLHFADSATFGAYLRPFAAVNLLTVPVGLGAMSWATSKTITYTMLRELGRVRDPQPRDWELAAAVSGYTSLVCCLFFDTGGFWVVLVSYLMITPLMVRMPMPFPLSYEQHVSLREDFAKHMALKSGGQA